MKTLSLLTLLMIPYLIFAQPTPEQIKEVEDAKKMVRKLKGQPFPDFELKTQDGATINSSDTKGKILLVNFWFTSCKPCVMEMPEMNEMVEKFKDEEIMFIAPTFNSKEMVDNFLSKRDFSYEIVPDEKDFCLELNIRSYPTHFVVNREGTIEKVVIGYSFRTVGALEKSIRKLLKSE